MKTNTSPARVTFSISYRDTSGKWAATGRAYVSRTPRNAIEQAKADPRPCEAVKLSLPLRAVCTGPAMVE